MSAAITEVDASRVHAKFLKQLESWLDGGECTAAQAAVIMKFLAHHQIELPKDAAQMRKLVSLVDSLPFSTTEEHGLAN